MKKFVLTIAFLLTTIPMSPSDWSLFSTKPKFKIEAQVQSVKVHIAVIDFSNDMDPKIIVMQLRDLARDQNIHGILLMIDNGGGEYNRFSPVHDMIKKVSAIKPVVGLVNGDAQSCGYWVASAANYLIASSICEIGCIGAALSLDRYYDTKIVGNLEANMQVEFFKAGKFKGLGSPYSEKLSEDDKKYVQEYVEKLYTHCVNQIAANRNLDPESYELWAEGKVFVAQEALELGLIDEIGTIFEAEDTLIAMIRERQPTIAFEDTAELIFMEKPAVQ
jgi:protease-4